MFNKFRKRGIKKSSKSKIKRFSLDGCKSFEVFINRVSNSEIATANLSPAVEFLPPLREVAVSERSSVLLRKIQLCCIVYDYSDNLKSIREKEIKRQTLHEILDIIQCGSFKFDEQMQEQLVEMVSVNIFRCLPPPPASHGNKWTETEGFEEEETYINLLWPHLLVVYEILLRYIVSFDTEVKIAKRYIDQTFVLKLMDLFDSEDAREREFLITILHQIYRKFMGLRPFIRKVISDIFYRFIFETERHNGVTELLEFQGSVINGFSVPLKEENRLFLFRALIPLHKPRCYATYYQQLSYCINQFLEKDFRLAEHVIRGLLKYWPVTNCQKEVLFLEELEEVLKATQSAEFQRCMVLLFRQIGRCLNSSHFQVAITTLGLWNNEHIVSLIAENREVIFPLILEAVEKNIKGHWNELVNGLTANLRGMLMKMDAKLYEDCHNLYLEKEAMAVPLETQRELTWKKLEALAAVTSCDYR